MGPPRPRARGWAAVGVAAPDGTSRIRIARGRRGRELRIDGTFASFYAPRSALAGPVWDALAAPLAWLPPARRRSVLILGLGGGRGERGARGAGARAAGADRRCGDERRGGARGAPAPGARPPRRPGGGGRCAGLPRARAGALRPRAGGRLRGLRARGAQARLAPGS